MNMDIIISHIDRKALGREFGNDGHDFNVGIRFYDQGNLLSKLFYL